MNRKLKDKIQGLADKYLQPFDAGYSLNGCCQSSISPAEGEYMHDFIIKHDLQNGIEIGTGPGYSGLYLGSALKKFYTVDNCAIASSLHWDESQVIAHWRKMFDEMGLIDVPLLKTVECSGLPKFDFAFIDGDHTNDAPTKDIFSLIPLMANNHHIFMHDTEGPYVREAIINAYKNGYKIETIQFPANVGNYGLTRLWT